jgi:trans-2,3-dihydro-3-hydroxyanthranilate isomerase
MRFEIVNVFAEHLGGGNPLAVVQDAGTLDSAEMQRIATQFNLSETTFVTARTADTATVRIFTPAAELPFAGHPSVGTAWVLSEGRGGISLQLPIGRVATSADGDGRLWIEAPSPTLGERGDPETCARLVGLNAAALHPELPPQAAAVGPRFLLLPLAAAHTLTEVRLDEGLHQALLAAGHPYDAVFLFAEQAPGADGDYAARMFFRTPEWREDPATGSANLCLAAYLQAQRGAPQAFTVAQGDAMGRPSRLALRADGDRYALGGRVQRFARGELIR